jgi:LysR family transcriptional regulator for metE and metH
MIQLKHLETILSLVKHGSVIKAAEALFTTQSALSHQIKQFEEQLNLKLFIRKSSPIQLTQAGKLLLKTANDILPRLHITQNNLKAIEQGHQGRLWIGVECHTCFEWLLPMLRAYQQQWPNIDLDLVNSLASINKKSELTALKNLKQQKLDLVITSDPIDDNDLVFKELFSYELVLVVSKIHKLAEKPWIKPQDLTTETLIHYPVDKNKLDIYKHFLIPANCQPKGERLSELTVMMLQLVEGQKGVCVLPKWLIESLPDFESLTTIRIGQKGLWSTLYATIHKQNEQQTYLNNFIQMIQESTSP